MSDAPSQGPKTRWQLWLGTAPSDDPLTELSRLRELLAPAALGTASDDLPLDQIHLRLAMVVGASIARLGAIRLPISPGTRQIVRTLTDVLELTATLQLRVARRRWGDGDDASDCSIAVWRALWALSRNMLVARLIAAPPTPGLWQQTHEVFQEFSARVGEHVPEGATCSVAALYLGTLARECAHSSMFTAAEWLFIDRYIDGQQHRVRRLDEFPTQDADRQGVFWVAIDHDAPPTALLRRAPSPDAFVLRFACGELIAAIDQDLARLRADPLTLKSDPLPRHLSRPVLKRLRAVWATPRKRRFPRRRQGYRARVCCGLDGVWKLLASPTPEDISEWMVVNESPDGYATMHVAGTPTKVQTGDVAAVRADGATGWQICLVRWAMSENPEHLELGLQLLAPRADAGHLSIIGNGTPRAPQAALLLPPIPPIRERALLITPPGMVRRRPQKLVFVTEDQQVNVREFQIHRLLDQSPSADVFLVDPLAATLAGP